MTLQRFKDTVWDFYHEHGRHSLPWRKTKNPYRIWVSEVMLQQTQVSRVIPKYKEFLKKFPTISALANAPLKDVLIVWQGLGYNRRAKLLHKGAKYIEHEHKGVFPKNELEHIPGIGPYTACAVQAFAFNVPSACIETNIRTVYLHHFFKDKEGVHDKEIKVIIEKTVDRDSPREWYWALMDYGACLKKNVRLNTKSAHYTKQTPFKGSVREVRGALIRELAKGRKNIHSLVKLFPTRKEEVQKQITVLIEEGLITKKGSFYHLAD